MTNLNEKRFEHWEQQKEFREEMEGDYKKLASDMIKLQNNLQIHTENYNQYIKRIIEVDKRHQQVVEKIDAYMQRSEPMLKWFEGMNVSRKTLMWILGLLGAVGSLILMYREITK